MHLNEIRVSDIHTHSCLRCVSSKWCQQNVCERCLRSKKPYDGESNEILSLCSAVFEFSPVSCFFLAVSLFLSLSPPPSAEVMLVWEFSYLCVSRLHPSGHHPLSSSASSQPSIHLSLWDRVEKMFCTSVLLWTKALLLLETLLAALH